ncbi:MAG TPA: hypothetical protein VFU82_03645 [Gammaproteobacteria bacterium]|nr:hypothetical protein [Gammaproteobacteria bacterium]
MKMEFDEDKESLHENIKIFFNNITDFLKSQNTDNKIIVMVNELINKFHADEYENFLRERDDIIKSDLNSEIRFVNDFYSSGESRREIDAGKISSIFEIVLNSLSNIFSSNKLGVLAELVKELFLIGKIIASTKG